MAGITIFILLCVFYPFFPGQYDSLAMPLSITAQVGVAIGLLLLFPIGILWLIYELRKQVQRKQNLTVNPKRYYFAYVSTILFSIIAIVVSLVAFATVGFSLAFITVVVWAIFFSRLFPNLQSMKAVERDNFYPVPIYFVFVPVVALFFQFVLGTPITNFSRDYAIANSKEYISDIEEYHAQYRNYPSSLLAMWKDYYPNIVGVEKFHYTPSDNAYNLFFEQPRLFFDNIGTREWVVYNPLYLFSVQSAYQPDGQWPDKAVGLIQRLIYSVAYA
jgi:hypothetical protein